MTQSFLSKNCRDLILGSLLGDGSIKIHPKYRNARFSFRHSIKQKDYFFWKVDQLKEISSERCWWEQKSGFGEGIVLRYQSSALPTLSELYHLTHPKKGLKINRKWLNQLTPLSLSLWWLDDGSIIANGRKGVFCTDAFSEAEHKILQQYLLKVWKIRTTLGKITRVYKEESRIYWRLWLRSTSELKKFLQIILPFVSVKSMLSKVILLYKDYDLQQRWISEVSEKTGFSKEIVERQLLEKKSRWKYFRE